MTLFPAELPMLFYIVHVSGYLGTLEKSQKIKLKISVLEASMMPKRGHRAARGLPGGQAARPPPWPCHLASWEGPTLPGALPWPYLFTRRGNSRTEVVFSIYIVEPPPPSVLLWES